MVDERPPTLAYIDEFHTEAMKIAAIAKEAAGHYENGNPASAALVIAMSHYRISDLDAERSNVLKLIEERDGVTPDDALKQMDE